MGEQAGTGGGEAVARGRAGYTRRAWLDAFTALTEADRLDAGDLERLGMSAMLIRRDGDAIRALERAHAGHLEAGDAQAAVRCAIWIGLELMNLGEPARANGWFSRAGRQLDRDGRDCVERGYLLVPDVLTRLGSAGAGVGAARRGRGGPDR